MFDSKGSNIPTTLEMFAVRVVGTKKVFLVNDRGIPSTYSDPMDPDGLTAGKIRLFRTHRSAMGALRAWKSGTFSASEDGIEQNKHLPYRKDVDLEIIPVQVILPPND